MPNQDATPLADAFLELLAAAKDLLGHIRERFPDDFKDDPDNFKCPHHKALAAAINRAEGR